MDPGEASLELVKYGVLKLSAVPTTRFLKVLPRREDHRKHVIIIIRLYKMTVSEMPEGP